MEYQKIIINISEKIFKDLPRIESFKSNEYFLLCGASGTGKTSFLDLLINYLKYEFDYDYYNSEHILENNERYLESPTKLLKTTSKEHTLEPVMYEIILVHKEKEHYLNILDQIGPLFPPPYFPETYPELTKELVQKWKNVISGTDLELKKIIWVRNTYGGISLSGKITKGIFEEDDYFKQLKRLEIFTREDYDYKKKGPDRLVLNNNMILRRYLDTEYDELVKRQLKCAEDNLLDILHDLF